MSELLRSTVHVDPELHKKIVFIGDSITDCERRGRYAPYGFGYVYHIYLWLSAAYPELHLDVVNRGVSGDTVRDLAGRWQADVIYEQPDWLFVKIGVNDVWRYMDNRFSEAVPEEEFEQTYRRLLEATHAGTAARLVLIEPFLVESNLSDPFRRQLDLYRAVVRRLAGEFQARLVKTQDAFDRGLESRSAAYWAGDRVHPTLVGHMLIAQEVLRACEGVGIPPSTLFHSQ